MSCLNVMTVMISAESQSSKKMSLNNDDKRGNSGDAGAGLSDLQTGSDPNGLVTGLMGLQQQQNGQIGLQTQDGNDANASSALMGGMSAGMMGGQGGGDGQHDPNSFLAQQQALMAMAAGAGTGTGAGFENSSNKDALMNLLAKQGKLENCRVECSVRRFRSIAYTAKCTFKL